MEIRPIHIKLKANTPAFMLKSGQLDFRKASGRVHDCLRGLVGISLLREAEISPQNFPAWLLLFAGGMELFYQHSAENDLLPELAGIPEIEIIKLETIRKQVKDIRILDNEGKKVDIPTDKLTNLQVAQIISAFGDVEGERFLGIEQIRGVQKTINVGAQQRSKVQGTVKVVNGSGRKDPMQFEHFPFSSTPLQPSDFSRIQFSADIFPTLFMVQANNR